MHKKLAHIQRMTAGAEITMKGHYNLCQRSSELEQIEYEPQDKKTKMSNKQDAINLIIGTGVHKCMCLGHSQGSASSMQLDLAGHLPTAN